MSNPSLPAEHEPPIRAQNSIAWIIWFTYGSFYFCRNNLSAAVPGMMRSVSEGGLGLDERQVGAILAALKITYAIGQLVNGQLAERISPRVLLAFGMIGSAALNVAFGFSTAAYFLIFIWATNGYCQSLGWTPSVRVLANWVPVHRRGKALGFVGTGYQISGALTFIVAGQAAEQLGWRGALFVPAVILLASAIVMLVLLEDAPEGPSNRRGRGVTASLRASNSNELTLGRTVWLTLSNPLLWLLGISLGLLDACRYGFTDWGLKHLVDVQGTGVGMAALKYAVLPAGGAAGAFVAGWATDRYFGSRRAPVACLLLLALGVCCMVYDEVANYSVPATVGLLLVIGFCIFGPQILLVGSAPADLARGGASAAAAGFVNSMGYAGAAIGDYFTGQSLGEWGWQKTIYMWAAWAFAAAIAAGTLWNVHPQRSRPAA